MAGLEGDGREPMCLSCSLVVSSSLRGPRASQNPRKYVAKFVGPDGDKQKWPKFSLEGEIIQTFFRPPMGCRGTGPKFARMIHRLRRLFSGPNRRFRKPIWSSSHVMRFCKSVKVARVDLPPRHLFPFLSSVYERALSWLIVHQSSPVR